MRRYECRREKESTRGLLLLLLLLGAEVVEEEEEEAELLLPLPAIVEVTMGNDAGEDGGRLDSWRRPAA